MTNIVLPCDPNTLDTLSNCFGCVCLFMALIHQVYNLLPMCFGTLDWLLVFESTHTNTSTDRIFLIPFLASPHSPNIT